MGNKKAATTTVEFYQNKLSSFRAELESTPADKKRARYLKQQIEIVEAKLSSMFPMKSF